MIETSQMSKTGESITSDEFISIEEAKSIIIPMDPQNVRILFDLVLHGATVEEYSKRYRLPDEEGEQTVRDYHILFPDGTEKYVGASFSPKKRSYFLLFPDGFKLFFHDIYMLGGWRTVLQNPAPPTIEEAPSHKDHPVSHSGTQQLL